MSIIVQSGGNVQVAIASNNVTQIQGVSPFEDDLKRYVQFLFENHATSVENSSVWEMAEQFFGHDLEEEELTRVFKLMDNATVEVVVTW